LAYQWLLDPDSNPRTPDAPQVVNSSWSFQNTACDLRFQPDLRALRAAGITPIFAAGNFGPEATSAPSPANYPEALAVGAVDAHGLVVDYSSRGPSPCEDGARLFPALSAPGLAIRTTAPGGGYTEASGTSLAAPQVAGGLALLLSAYPHLPLGWQEGALLFSARDLGAPGPDYTYGMGLLDLPAALAWLQARYIPPPTPTPAPTPWRFYLPVNRQGVWPIRPTPSR
jgi:subtilisin family serine protease